VFSRTITRSIGCGVGDLKAGERTVLQGRTLAYRERRLRSATIGDV
jgi:hypothetical protein